MLFVFVVLFDYEFVLSIDLVLGHLFSSFFGVCYFNDLLCFGCCFNACVVCVGLFGFLLFYVCGMIFA